jgi:hypothetical protein
MPIVREIAHYKNGRLTYHWPRFRSRLGDTLDLVGVIAFTPASLLIVDLASTAAISPLTVTECRL